MTNVVSFLRPPRNGETAEGPNLPNALAEFAASASRIAHLPVRNKHDLEQAIKVLELINRNAPTLIGLVADDGKKAKLLEQNLRTKQLLESLRADLDKL